MWSLGCTFYEILTGKESPFFDKSEFNVLKKVVRGEVDYPPNMNEDAKDLIQKLLRRNPLDRIGSRKNGGFNNLKNHPYFEGINFDDVVHEEPSFVPKRKHIDEMFEGFSESG